MRERTRTSADAGTGAGTGWGFWFRWYYSRYLYWPACLLGLSVLFALVSSTALSAWGPSLALSLGGVGLLALLVLAIYVGYRWLWPATEPPRRSVSFLRKSSLRLDEPGHPMERRW